METVPFEIAKKLKEKGFREKVNAYYGKHENIFDVHPALDMNDSDYRVSAPTISQVLKWLREKKHKFVGIEFFNYEIGFGYKLIRLDYVVRLTEKQRYKTYEEAAIAGIEYCLDNLI